VQVGITIPPGVHQSYSSRLLEWQARAKASHVQLHAVPGEVRHHWHGSLKHRQYVSRWDIVRKLDVDRDTTHNAFGLLVLTHTANPSVVSDVAAFYATRFEDGAGDAADNGDGGGDSAERAPSGSGAAQRRRRRRDRGQQRDKRASGAKKEAATRRGVEVGGGGEGEVTLGAGGDIPSDSSSSSDSDSDDEARDRDSSSGGGGGDGGDGGGDGASGGGDGGDGGREFGDQSPANDESFTYLAGYVM
jgi:hypothetical protein